MVFQFKKATKYQLYSRIALIGPSGSGKTFTALKLMTYLVPGGRIAVVDTEHGSASKYADLFDFDVLELTNFNPQNYIDAIKAAEAAGYAGLNIDSMSHAWMGVGGALEMVDKATARSQSKNSFAAWKDITPLQNALIEACLSAKLHLIVTMRTKTEYVVEKDEKTGKSSVRKVGLAPIQRDGLEYEFDVVADMDINNNFIVSKSRCPALTGAVINKPGEEVAKILNAWLAAGVEMPPEPEPAPTPPAQTTAPQPPIAPTNGNGHASQSNGKEPKTRPLSAADLKDMISRRVITYSASSVTKDAPVPMTTQGQIAGKIEECFAGEGDEVHKENLRHLVMQELVGVNSTKLLTMPQAKALQDWLGITVNKDTGEYLLHAAAPQEAHNVLESSIFNHPPAPEAPNEENIPF